MKYVKTRVKAYCVHIMLICCIMALAPFASPAVAAPSPVATTDEATASSIVDYLIPGATTNIVSDPGTQQTLQIILPQSAASGQLTHEQQQFIDNNLGWRARIAASLVAAQSPSVSTWVVDDPDGSPPDANSDAFHGGTAAGASLGNPKLDSVSVSAATAQLQSNVQAFRSILPTGAYIGDSIRAYQVGNSNEFALEVDITLASSKSLDGHFGDAIGGLQTGLTGDSTASLIEGLAIQVESQDSTPIVGSWQTARSPQGTLQFANPDDQTQSLAPTTQYVNLTGGPSTKTTVLGGFGHENGSRHLAPSPAGSKPQASDSGFLGVLALWGGFSLLLALLALVYRQRLRITNGVQRISTRTRT